ncbi:DUF6268 family outer membrane beta-barrel protein [Dokdonia ponticola]|uniref:DUF6268 family outer membrane beta-barrel protein n=1 Tax=Dokdonia ponticola TaxID=2041041 RepID=A0ABV9I1E9_9FLAO
MPKKILFIIVFVSGFVHAQISELARVEYVGLPERAEETGTSFNRFRGSANYPIKLKEDTYFVIGADFSYIDFNIDQDLVGFDANRLDRFQLLDINFGYTTKINEDWRIAVQIQPGFSTNATVKELSLRDNGLISGGLFFLKDKKKEKTPRQLILGISISPNAGFPILPFISYYHKFHPNWSYKLGVPKMNIQYHLSEKNRLKFVVRLDGFRTNLQRDVFVEGENGPQKVDFLRQRLLLGGIRYEYKFTKNLEYYLNASYIIDNSLEFRDRSRNTIAELPEDNLFYLKTGVRFKL